MSKKKDKKKAKTKEARTSEILRGAPSIGQSIYDGLPLPKDLPPNLPPFDISYDSVDLSPANIDYICNWLGCWATACRMSIEARNIIRGLQKELQAREPKPIDPPSVVTGWKDNQWGRPQFGAFARRKINGESEL